MTTSFWNEAAPPSYNVYSVTKILTITMVGLLDSAVVRDVLTLGHDPIQVKTNLRMNEVVVLPDDALSLLPELGLRIRVPPVLQVPYGTQSHQQIIKHRYSSYFFTCLFQAD